MPYYELEAWLYQSLDEVRKLCCGSPDHIERIDRWTANRAALDEEPRPKKEALPCIADQHNQALARAFNPEIALTARASYEHAVMQHLLQDSPDLLSALERTTQLP